MTRSKLTRIAAVALFAAASSTTFAAQDTATLTVTASIAAKCKLTVSGAMAFGSLDPTLSTDPTATATASYKCTKGTAVTSFQVGTSTSGSTGATGSMTGASASPDSIPFKITWTDPGAVTGTGLGATGTATDVLLTGTILNANYVDKKVDSYTGTIGLAVNY